MEELKGKIGLEIHTYLITKEKLFCDCIASREKGLKANINVCPICTGMPGAKPMLPNEEAVKKAVMIGLMLGCKINENMQWKRKHYSWPDMPKGYQNTLSGAHAVPTGVGGKLNEIRIRSMHLEEDPASWEPDTGRVDYNRSGLPLVEIITEPDFSTAKEVGEWLRKLVHNLSYLKIVDADAGIKVDVNVNLPGKTERVEVKNINSIENIELAINYEFERQAKEGGKIKETRRYDSEKGKTEVMRSKEDSQDYRFISDPDLMDLVIDNKFISDVEKNIPEMPDVKLAKLIKKFKIDETNALVLAKNVDIAEFFEKVASKIDGKFALPWVTGGLLHVLNYNKTTLDKVHISVEHFTALLEMVKSGKITELQAKQILNKFYPKSFSPDRVEGKITNEKELVEIAGEVIRKNLKAVSDYKNGDENALNYLMGEIMKATQKRADFSIARAVLQKLLK
jgi:aspartyl-tRNA(Asn)/glutamyl-tRNA(Gln) amidotransferase subunit B